MFEDYFFSGEDNEISLPLSIYRMMQFIDFSFHETYRCYANPVESFEDHQFGFVYNDRESDKIVYKDFIKSFKLIFDV